MSEKKYPSSFKNSLLYQAYMYVLKKGIRSPENTWYASESLKDDVTAHIGKGIRIEYYITHCNPEDRPTEMIRRFRNEHSELRREITIKIPKNIPNRIQDIPSSNTVAA